LGPKRGDVTGGWRKLQNEELHNLYSSTKYYYADKIKEDVVDGIYTTHGR
jgi:hypothetical protein